MLLFDNTRSPPGQRLRLGAGAYHNSRSRRWVVDDRGRIKRYGRSGSRSTDTRAPSSHRTTSNSKHSSRDFEHRQSGERGTETREADDRNSQPPGNINQHRDGDNDRDSQTKDDSGPRERSHSPATADRLAVETGPAHRYEVYEASVKARKSMENHRQSYRHMRHMHFQRQDPGLPNWNLEWSREEFDIQHLRHAMHLSSQVRDLEKRLAIANRWCSKYGRIIRKAISGTPTRSIA